MPSMGHSTLSTRYIRLQTLFATWPAADDALLLRAKKTIEEMVEKERGGSRHEGKWEKMALRKRWEVLVGVERKEDGARGEEVGDDDDGQGKDEQKGAGERAVGEYDGHGDGHEEDDEEKS